jgi:hypothetical protein
MNYSSSPKDKLLEGKRRLSRAPDNPDTLERALEIIDAALLEHLRSIPAYANKSAYYMFIMLQERHIINAAERAVISQMHELRNRSAHANPLYLTSRYVNQYSDLALKVMDKTDSRASIKPRKKKPKPAKRQAQPNNTLNSRLSPSSPVRLKPEVLEEPRSLLEVEPEPIEKLEPVLTELPGEELEPVLSEPAATPQDNVLLSQLLEIELGSTDDNELLRQLLSTSPGTAGTAGIP